MGGPSAWFWERSPARIGGEGRAPTRLKAGRPCQSLWAECLVLGEKPRADRRGRPVKVCGPSAWLWERSPARIGGEGRSKSVGRVLGFGREAPRGSEEKAGPPARLKAGRPCQSLWAE